MDFKSYCLNCIHCMAKAYEEPCASCIAESVARSVSEMVEVEDEDSLIEDVKTPIRFVDKQKVVDI